MKSWWCGCTIMPVKKPIRVPLKVFINGAQKALGSFTVAARAVQTDTLAFMGLQAGWQQGLVDSCRIIRLRLIINFTLALM
jgi:hypothetical protein